MTPKQDRTIEMLHTNIADSLERLEDIHSSLPNFAHVHRYLAKAHKELYEAWVLYRGMRGKDT